MNTEKAMLRRQLRDSRLSLAPEFIAEKSHIITKKLLNAADWTAVANLHCYEALTPLNEVGTKEFMAFLVSNFPKIQVFTSRKNNAGWLVTNTKTNLVDEEQIFDVIIVPMLGFDPGSLHRIGYGGGYYDRLLVTQPRAQKIGLCFEQGNCGKIRAQAHDIPMDIIITEEMIYR